MKKRQKPTTPGFTLVELLVVIAIVAVLALLAFVTSVRMIDKGKKVAALAQFRDLNAGFTMFEVDYQKPPLPPIKRGKDTIYGVPGGEDQNGYLIAVLVGDPKDFTYGGDSFKVDDVNPQHNQYIVFPTKADKKGGVGLDGNLYDPWGGQIIAAINGGKLPGKEDEYADVGSISGTNDRLLDTNGYGEYSDTKPRDQDFVFWSYGHDAVKGDLKSNPGKDNQAKIAYAGSDDVVNW